MSETWRAYKRATEGVEGWFHDAASAASDAMLRHQRPEVQGDMLEIGAWHGKSAALWLTHARRGREVLHIVDFACAPELYDTLERIGEATGVTYKLTKNTSARFPDAAFFAANRRALRMIHIDGDHTAPGIANDLQLCPELLNPVRGLIIVDDFMNYRFPQITEVVYAFLAARRQEFAMFACGDNKAFICTARAFDYWAEFADEGLRREVEALVPCSFYEATWEGRPLISFRTR